MKKEEYPHIEYIYNRLLEDMVSVDVPRRLLNAIFKYFREYLFFELLEENVVNLKGIGKFRLHKKKLYAKSVPEGRFAPGAMPEYQYHIKFKVSPNLSLRIREIKGTTSLAEAKTLAQKREFIEERWRTRESHMSTKGGTHMHQLEYIKRKYREKRARIRELQAELEVAKLIQQSE